MSGERRALAKWATSLCLGLIFLPACGGGAESPNSSPSPATPATSSPSGGEESLKVAMILPGKHDDFGFSQVGASALDTIATKFGAETIYAESVPVAQQVETFRDFARRGFNLIIGWGGQYNDGAKLVAAEFPDTFFVVILGVGSNGSNFASSDLSGEQWDFLDGYVDGKATKTNKVGMLSGPCFDATARASHGFEQGVKFANPAAEVKIVQLDSFDDASAAKEAALALADEGVDVIHLGLNTGNLGAFEAAKERGILVSAQFYDQNQQAPEVVLTSDLRNEGEAAIVAAQMVADGSFDGSPIRVALTADPPALAPFYGLAPDSLYQEALSIQERVASGEIKVEADGSCPY